MTAVEALSSSRPAVPVLPSFSKGTEAELSEGDVREASHHSALSRHSCIVCKRSRSARMPAPLPKRRRLVATSSPPPRSLSASRADWRITSGRLNPPLERITDAARDVGGGRAFRTAPIAAAGSSGFSKCRNSRKLDNNTAGSAANAKNSSPSSLLSQVFFPTDPISSSLPPFRFCFPLPGERCLSSAERSAYCLSRDSATERLKTLT
mmetsp:Transcript_22012/g.43694  ORF Transcript_22012/g.43694 Transcript_22012/m.43694 type:complete len:208 (-) Transcript_22012:126-749(-)